MKFNPEMLLLARQMRRMTQVRLARASNTSQAAISKSENGQVVPTEEMLSAWAEALEVPVSFFGREARTSAVPVTFFRKKASLPATDARQITATIAVRSWQIERLISSIEMPPVNVSSLAPSDGRTASDIARELRQAWGYPRGPIPNLVEALESAGIVVVFVPELRNAHFDGLSVWRHRAGNPPVMFLNDAVPIDRLRFTMAHELGHIVMHHHQTLPPDECEDEADAFAAEFLMPAREIGPQLSSLTIDKLAELKKHWRVSMQSILYRAKTLGRISPRTSRRLWQRLSALGYRRNEPISLPPEEPGLLDELIRVHAEDLGYADEELAAAIGMLSGEFASVYRRLPARPTLRRVK